MEPPRTLESIQANIRAIMEHAKTTHAYRAEGASLEITEAIWLRMEKLAMKRSELARAIGVSPAYITRIMGGSTNFTLDTMVKIATVLGCELRLGLKPVRRETDRSARSGNRPRAKAPARAKAKPAPPRKLAKAA